eukprot:COSAG02_NODE_22_length_53020_cov_16.223125_5_plen_34_part_00
MRSHLDISKIRHTASADADSRHMRADTHRARSR